MIFYNIHNLMKIESNEPMNKLQHFESAKFSDPDITIFFGKFNLKHKKSNQTGKCFIENHSLYCEDVYKLSYWRILFKNLNRPHTTIHFCGDPLFSKDIFLVLLLEPFLTYKFSQKNILLLHSSAFSHKDKGIIISGETGIGKTTTLLKLLTLPETKYYADDQAIVKGTTLYSYPMPIGLRTHLVRTCKLKLHTKDMIYILLHNVINILTKYYGNLTHRISPENIILKNTQTHIMTGTKIGMSQVFTLSLGDKFQIKKLTPEEALERLLRHNRGNEDKQKIIYRYLIAYKQVYPEFNYWEKFKDLLTMFVNTYISFHNIQLSRKYKITKNLQKIIEILEKEKCC